MTKSRELRIAAVTPPVDRGKAMLPAEVAREIFTGQVSGRWVLDNAPLRYRGHYGKKIVFRELDMIEWRETMFGTEG